MNQVPLCQEIARQTDQKRFILPRMNPDELEEFVTFIIEGGYTTHQYMTAQDSFRKSLYLSFLSYRKKK